MGSFKKLGLVAGFALLAACGSDADKFAGEWIDPSPKKAEEKSDPFSYASTNDITIKAVDSNKVEVTSDIFGREHKNVYSVNGENIISGTRVIYTLKGDELVDSLGKRLIRK
ncbi:hypothetical protein AXE65_12820 [Ventosimonas gracilis]|uniref:Lipoprotein n=1 Tax=Ventosimonas gracilis TaxID=1680762 RepID=A0A139SVJ4_9GAMM|nr:hypothetical protein [Ventosimonas gracilis]KXU38554.1 hypothetical protein AXE65_12820 [Ventosimonas gracilis]